MFDGEAGGELLAQLQDEATTSEWRATVDTAAPGFDEWISPTSAFPESWPPSAVSRW